MAVHTHLSKIEILDILKNYNLGNLKNYEGIKDGIENTNYLINTEKKKIILTIFESRTELTQIPKIFELLNHLNKNGILCPKPIFNKKENLLNSFRYKKYSLFNFLEGTARKNWDKNHCYNVGKILGKIHLTNLKFKYKIKNSFGQVSWKKIFNSYFKKSNNKFKNLNTTIYDEISYLESSWPKKLPKSIIHADFFPDNVFFSNQNVTGVIDFYFSCYDLMAYDLAITTNAWCFKKGKFNKSKFQNLIFGYESVRTLTEHEKKKFNILLRGASLRFLLTRIFDYVYGKQNRFLKKKDPLEYFNILCFHMKNQDENYFK
tara:strand:- start:1521 stop:2474 length:954 start_codon:yes stop_codon:yes gene_type:complete